MSIMPINTALINYEVFNDGKRWLGSASVELPNIEMENSDLKGAGIMGTISFPTTPMMASLEVKITWRTLCDNASAFLERKSLDLDLYGDAELYDSATGAIKDQQIRISVRGVNKTLNIGKFEPSSTMDAETTLEAITLRVFVDGNQIIDIDKLNYKYEINGTDWASGVRRTLGLDA